ncbi:MAG: hypothetical protein ILO53_09000 [Clostridia bacterium]|nr:hypothetical protein [Clostridia bacterium]
MKRIFALVLALAFVLSAAAVSAYAADFRKASFDSFYTNRGLEGEELNFGKGDGVASDKLDSVNRTIDSSDGSVKNVSFRGWIGFEQELQGMGYKINNNEVVFVEGALDFNAPDIAAVQAKENGGAYAARFEIVVPTEGLTNTNTIVIVAKAGGDLYEIDENAVASGDAKVPNTKITFIGIADDSSPVDGPVDGPVDNPTDDPVTPPPTGDNGAAILAIVAVLALGAVIFARKKVF